MHCTKCEKRGEENVCVGWGGMRKVCRDLCNVLVENPDGLREEAPPYPL